MVEQIQNAEKMLWPQAFIDHLLFLIDSCCLEGYTIVGKIIITQLDKYHDRAQGTMIGPKMDVKTKLSGRNVARDRSRKRLAGNE